MTQDSPFSPYMYAEQLAKETGTYVVYRSGINWTWVTFTSETIRQRFDKECRKHGYRVRDYGECQTLYHHYQD